MLRLGVHLGPVSTVWIKPRKFDYSDFGEWSELEEMKTCRFCASWFEGCAFRSYFRVL